MHDRLLSPHRGSEGKAAEEPLGFSVCREQDTIPLCLEEIRHQQSEIRELQYAIPQLQLSLSMAITFGATSRTTLSMSCPSFLSLRRDRLYQSMMGQFQYARCLAADMHKSLVVAPFSPVASDRFERECGDEK